MPCLLLSLLLCACSKAPVEAPKAKAVIACIPLVCDVPLSLTYVGHVKANVSIEVRPQVAGVITGQYFVEGEKVEAGQLLMRIDDRPYKSALAKAQATLGQNLASLKQARDTQERYSKLVPDEFVSRLNYDQYVTNVVVDEAVIQENIADVDTARINLDYCSITAPLSGITGSVAIKPGNYVEAGNSTALFVLNQIQPILIHFYVPQRDLPRIQARQRMGKLRTIAYLQHTPYEGELTLINNEVDQSTGTILMRATLPNADMSLWPGEFVDVRLILETVQGGILLPQEAIKEGQQGPFVYIISREETAELRPVQIEERIGSLALVKSGIRPEEKVVLEGQYDLLPGQKVHIVETRQLHCPHEHL